MLIFFSIGILLIDLEIPLTLKIGGFLDLNFNILNFFTEGIASFYILLSLYRLSQT